MEEKIFTLKEAAQYLKVSRKKIAEMLKNNDIPGKKVGKRWRFSKDSLDKWLAS